MSETKEVFWGCALTKDSKEYAWSAGEDAEIDVNHKLQISQACLGPKAKDNERNLVQVTTENEDGKKVSFCILSLRAPQNEQLSLDLGFTSKSKFKLVEGTGPVHLTGCHLQAMGFDEMDSGESSGDEVMEDSAVALKGSPSKVLRMPALAGIDSDDEESDDDDDVAGKNKAGLLDDEASDDEDDESFDPDEDEDEEDDEDDEDDDSDEEEEEEVQPPAKKKKLPNGKAPAAKEVKAPKSAAKVVNGKSTPKKPSEDKNADKKGKTPQAKTPKTPTGPKSIDDVKKSLAKSPNLPKTLDKFKNFMRSAHRVTDDKEVSSIWEWVQKSKK